MEAVSNSALVTLSGVTVTLVDDVLGVTLSDVVTAVTVTLDDLLGVTLSEVVTGVTGVTLDDDIFGVTLFLTSVRVTLADLVGAKVVEADAVVVTLDAKTGVTDLADENNLVTKDIFVPDVTDEAVGVTSDLIVAIESTVDEVFVTLVTDVTI